VLEEPHPTPETSNEDGVSLEELTAAFSRAMGVEPPQDSAPAENVQASDPSIDSGTTPTEAPLDQSPPPEPDDPCPISPTTILEAMLFVGNREHQPLTPQQAADLMRGVTPGEVAGVVDLLNQRYRQQGCPYEIISEGAGYRLTLRKAFHRLRDQFYGRVREVRLSQAAVDTLAIVAYQQPITAQAISKLRGRPTGHLLAQLVRRGLLRIVRHEGGSQTPRYRTTDRFLELFGLETLSDLPQSEELDRL
jgi:segregation and condensation protein B